MDIDIRVFVLKNGTTIIGELLEERSNYDDYCIRRPLEIKGDGENISLHPYLSFTEDYESGMLINKVVNFLCVLTPNLELKERYMGNFINATLA
jgi:hypothetical protein